jgi:hypothetical protein
MLPIARPSGPIQTLSIQSFVLGTVSLSFTMWLNDRTSRRREVSSEPPVQKLILSPLIQPHAAPCRPDRCASGTAVPAARWPTIAPPGTGVHWLYTESWKTAARYSFRTWRVVHDSQRADMLLALSLQVANFPIAGHPYCAPCEDVRLKAAAWHDASVEGVQLRGLHGDTVAQRPVRIGPQLQET